MKSDELEKLEEALKKHREWICGQQGGVRANLRGADLGYSALPLWRGSLDIKVDAAIARQLAYHF